MSSEQTAPTTSHTSAAAFAAKWRDSARRERASSQEHFIDLCRLLGVPTPNDPPASSDYTFEAGAERLSTGGQGWADVWKRGHFGWEYKGDRADLAAAYRQLLDYREDLANPPILVVSDMDRIEVHTNFTGTRPAVHEVTLEDLEAGGERTGEALRILRAVMLDPEELRPEQTPDEITRLAASGFAQIAQSMRERGYEPEAVAHHLNRVVFCLFAEDARLLPARILTGLIESRRSEPKEFDDGLAMLFRTMSDPKASRFFGNDRVDWFNGGLFDSADVIPSTADELRAMHDAALLDWSRVEPAILGTLFERGLDPAKRGQLGAHYTDHEKIMMVVEPVVLDPLRREFAAMRERVEELTEGREPTPLTLDGRRRERLPAWERAAEEAWRAFLDRLRAVRVLDPACGSGNFLYVTLRLLKDLEHEAMQWGAERLRITGEFPQVGPQNVLGIEINPYARELAGVSIWIGHIQWMLDHGSGFARDPVLESLDNIERRDAILARDAEGAPVPATWPEAEFVVGNPPFLGAGGPMRASLGDPYVEDLFKAWGRAVRDGADLVCYWHEIARRQITEGKTLRAGLLATNSIRGGANRATLDRVKESGDIFMAWSDEPWTVEGAAVRVSIVAQDDGSEAERKLDGESVNSIHSDLTGGGVDLTDARTLAEGQDTSFMGSSKKAPFDIPGDVARELLCEPSNINGRPNADVVVPWVNGLDLTRRPRDMFIIDFGTEMGEANAAEYQAPFTYIEEHVRPVRARNRRRAYRERWWRHAEPRPAMRRALAPLGRFIATPTIAKHRLFVWLPAATLPDQQLIAIAREDDYTFGVLHSRAHELWALRLGTSLEDRPRYTPTSTFETFPFPWPLDTPEDALTGEQRAHQDAVAEAARALDEARSHWLNPPDLVREEPDVVPSLPPRLLPVDEEAEKRLKKRTLTNLYNERPTWLANLHDALDAAVFAAYGWPEAPGDLGEEEMLGRLLALNLERSGE